MATFLELCAKVARESGAIPTAPVTVTGQTGRQAKCVEWVRQAWEQIQADNPDWTFLRAEFEGALSIGTMTYDASALGIDDFSRWLPERDDYSPVSIYASGDQADETTLTQIPYERWRSSFNRGTHDAMQPVYWAISPSGDLCVGPKPDAAYVLRGEYQRSPQVLSADGDIPIMPVQYHDAIVWRANMLLAGHDEAPVAFQNAYGKYQPILLNMERDLLPAVEASGNAIA